MSFYDQIAKYFEKTFRMYNISRITVSLEREGEIFLAECFMKYFFNVNFTVYLHIKFQVML